jgi:hypothetical protein
VRLDSDWRGLQPTRGAWSASYVAAIDACVNDARASGLRVLMLFAGTPWWAGTGRWQDGPRNVSDFAAAVGYMAAHFRGRVAAWEVWNEENSRVFWTNTTARYVQLLRAAYPAIHRADPGTLVVSGGIEHADAGWVAAAYRAGIKGSFDALGVHPYEQHGASYTSTAGIQATANVRRVMLANGDTRAVWFTEFSWVTGTITDDQQQAVYLRRATAAMRALPYVKMALWYELYTPYRNTDSEYALLDQQLRPRAAFAAFKAWTP